MEIGTKTNQIETAKKMLSEQFPVDTIARISGLALSEIQQLKQQTIH